MKVGDYIRTKKGIEKITYIRESMTLGGYEKYMTSDKRAYKNLTDFASIIKSSPNIIDLIEVGDYVNGFRINYIFDDSIEFFSPQTECDERFYNEDINSIVTKEQFSQTEYKVGE